MTLNRGLLGALALAALLPLGCGKSGGASGKSRSAPPEKAESAAPALQETASRVEAGRGPKSGRPMAPGLVGALLHQATEELALTDQQKAAIGSLEERLKSGGSLNMLKAVHADLAAGVRANNLDTAKLASDEVAMEQAMRARHDAEVAALDGLYAALDSSQRKALVASARARHPGGPGAPREPPAGAEAHMRQRHLEWLTKQLDLDDEQRTKVAAVLTQSDESSPRMDLAKRDGMQRLEALLAAFERDGFDATKLELPGPTSASLRDGVEQEIQVHVQLLPLLRSAQREKLAANLEGTLGGMEPTRPGAGPPGGPPGGLPAGSADGAPPHILQGPPPPGWVPPDAGLPPSPPEGGPSQ